MFCWFKNLELYGTICYREWSSRKYEGEMRKAGLEGAQARLGVGNDKGSKW